MDIKRMRGEMQAMAGDIRDKERRVTELEQQIWHVKKELEIENRAFGESENFLKKKQKKF